MSAPLNVIVELSSYCQLACPFCRTGQALRGQYSQVPRGVMTRQTFKNIIFQVPSIGEMLLYNWGEPFLNPDILWFVLFGKKMAATCVLSTNMHIMTESLAHGLIEAGLDKIFVSCDGLTQESYSAYRRGGSLETVLKNARLLADTRNRLGARHPEIVFQCIVNRFNEHEIAAYEEFAKAHGADRVRLIPLCGLTPEGYLLQEEYAPSSPLWPPFRNLGRLRNCTLASTNVVFDWNGDVYTCCTASGIREYCMGNINENSFDEIWNNEKYAYVRRFCNSGNPEMNDFKMMCYACYGVFPSEEYFRSDMWCRAFEQ